VRRAQERAEFAAFQTPKIVLFEFAPRRPSASKPHVDDEVSGPPRHCLAVATKQFANSPPCPVSHHRTADLPRRCDAETTVAPLLGQQENDQVLADHLHAFGVDPLELRAAPQPVQIAPALL
jgi:hypothetical protein